MEKRLLPQGKLDEIYVSYVAGIFRTLRFGAGEPHGRAEMMEFNYLLERKALAQNGDGRYVVEFSTMPAAIESLAAKLLAFEAQGDRAGAEAWFVKYDVMPAALNKVLETTSDIPVDVVPEFELSKEVRP